MKKLYDTLVEVRNGPLDDPEAFNLQLYSLFLVKDGRVVESEVVYWGRDAPYFGPGYEKTAVYLEFNGSNAARDKLFREMYETPYTSACFAFLWGTFKATIELVNSLIKGADLQVGGAAGVDYAVADMKRRYSVALKKSGDYWVKQGGTYDNISW